MQCLRCFYCCCLLIYFFSKLTFSKKINSETVSNRLDPDQDWHSVGSHLGPKCLQRLSEDDKLPLTVNSACCVNLHDFLKKFFQEYNHSVKQFGS